MVIASFLSQVYLHMVLLCLMMRVCLCLFVRERKLIFVPSAADEGDSPEQDLNRSLDRGEGELSLSHSGSPGSQSRISSRGRPSGLLLALLVGHLTD